MPRLIHVLVVDDSALIRQILTRALSMDPRIEIVGSAKTGVEAIEKARELQPDVITLDIEMPELSGLEALPHIRRHCDARVVMLSSLDDPETTYRALSLGAVDFIPKPHTGVAGSITELTEVLLKTIKTAYRITPKQAETVMVGLAEGEAPPAADGPAASGPIAACVAITSSTGGPPALETVMRGLAASLPAAYLIVQHLPPGFSASLAKRLDGIGEVRAVEAEDGMALQSATAYVAPHGWHMVVEQQGKNAIIRLADYPAIHGVRPAGDFMMKSVADLFGPRAVGVVLTGMGADGAEGALTMKTAGADVVLQDEATSVVWGMPGSAYRLGASTRTVPIGLVAAEVRRAVRTRADRGPAL